MAAGSFYSKAIKCDMQSEGPLMDLPLATGRKPSDLRLLGTGMRKVTIFQFEAYTISLYIPRADAERIKCNKRWSQEYNSSKLTGSDKQFYIKDIVESDLVLEIQPVRVTNGGHLVSGIARFLNQKYKENDLSPTEARDFKNALGELKSSFPKLQIVTGASIVFKKSVSRLEVTLNGHEIAKIDNEHLSKWFFEAYLGSISPSFVNSVGIGLENILG